MKCGKDVATSIELLFQLFIRLCASRLIVFIFFMTERRTGEVVAGRHIVRLKFLDRKQEHRRKTIQASCWLSCLCSELGKCMIRTMHDRVCIKEDESFCMGFCNHVDIIPVR